MQTAIRIRYAAAANRIQREGSCCAVPCDPVSAGRYEREELTQLGLTAGVSLGCGNPIALAELHPGEHVLDLGSGAGLDVLLSARRVGPGGHAYGVDMTDEMLAVANQNKGRAGVANATFLKGSLEALPLPADSTDVVISNCVINLAMEKTAVLCEAFRVLKPGGRLAVADMVEVEPLPRALKRLVDASAGCIAGTIPVGEYRRALTDAGFADVQIEVTRTFGGNDVGFPDVVGKIGSASIRARKPGATVR